MNVQNITDPSLYVEELQTVLATNHPQEHAMALNARFSHVAQEIQLTNSTYPNAKKWLAMELDQTSNQHALSLKKHTSTSKINYSLQDIVYAQAIQHMLQIFVCNNDQLSLSQRSICHGLFSELDKTEMQTTAMHKLFHVIHRTVENTYNCRADIEKILTNIVTVFKNDKPGLRLINELSIIHRQATLMLLSEQLAYVLHTTISQLESLKVKLRKSTPHYKCLDTAIQNLKAHYISVGEYEANLIAPPHRLCSHMYSNPSINRLPYVSLWEAVERRNLVMVEDLLLSGADPYHKVNNQSIIKMAYQSVNCQTSLDILNKLLEHVKDDDQESLPLLIKTDAIESDTFAWFARNAVYKKLFSNLPKHINSLKYTIRHLLTNNNLTSIKELISMGFNPLENVISKYDQLISITTRSISMEVRYLWNYQPYNNFTGCNNSLMTYFMARLEFDTAKELLLAAKQQTLDPHQLGMHLVVAAQSNKPELVQELITAGADQTVPYPCGRDLNKTVQDFAKTYGFSLTPESNIQKSLLQDSHALHQLAPV